MQNTGMKSETALLGGSFNPIHIGHLSLIHDAYELAGVEKVILIPALLSNFKRSSHPLDFDIRVELIELAIKDYRDIWPEDDVEIEVSLIEKERGGISYTSDTIRHFLPFYAKDGKIDFIIGDDILANLDKWHEYSFLREHVRFLCFVRDGGSREYPKDADILFFNNSKVISSSSAVRCGEMDMLSKRVRRYVEDNGLYRA